MMKRMYSLILLIMMVCGVSAQFSITYPTQAEDITPCDCKEATLFVKVRADANTTTNKVTINLSPGVTYVENSVTIIPAGTTTNKTIAYTGTDLRNPEFTISDLNANESIEFTIKRIAGCDAYNYKGVFKDVVNVSGNINGSPVTVTEEDPEKNVYNIFFPDLTLEQSAAITNATPGSTYTRDFYITNGATTPVANVYLTITYPTGIEPQSLEIGGTVVNYTNKIDNKYFYTLSGTLLGADEKLSQDEKITLTEKVKILTCDATTTQYAVGWGNDPNEWCNTSTGSSKITIAAGNPAFTALSAEIIDFKDKCTPFKVKFTFTNGGIGNTKAATMYNAVLQFGSAVWGYFSYGSFSNDLHSDLYDVVGATINGYNVLPYLTKDPNPDPNLIQYASTILTIDLSDKLNTDQGLGLQDIDGDGYYDDLPGGQTLTVILTIKHKCDIPCNDAIYSNVSAARMKYNTMCDPTQVTSDYKTFNTFSNYRRTGQGNAYAPSNIYGGQEFTAYFAVVTTQYDAANNPNTRYEFEIEIPQGLSIDLNSIMWHEGEFSENPTSYHPNDITLTQNDNILKVRSNREYGGWISAKLTYDCNSYTDAPVSIPYIYRHITNVSTNCLCNSEAVCAELKLTNILCEGECLEGGASINYTKVERADNSLGWKDVTLTERQNRNNIADYQLSRALYLDEIIVKANGYQRIGSVITNASGNDNLYLQMDIDRTGRSSMVDKLQAIDMQVVIKRGTTVLASGTLTDTDLTMSSAGSTQSFIWNLSSLVNTISGGLQKDDTFETTARYTVIATDIELPGQDILTGKKIYFYNQKDNAKYFCTNLIPEMYLVGPTQIIGQNDNNVLSGCNPINYQDGVAHFAYRFNAAGLQFINEIRPGFRLIDFSLTIPNGYDIEKIILLQLNQFDNLFTPTELTTPTVTPSGDHTIYTYTFPEHVYSIKVTNFYNFIVNMLLKPTCTSAKGVITTTVHYIPHYYHYKDKPLPESVTYSIDSDVSYNEATRPNITLTNQTGTVQAYKKEHSWTMRMANNSTSTAPYTWMAIPTQQGITIKSVTDLSTNMELSPISYSEGIWFKLSEAGLAPGASNDYEIIFEYATCPTGTVQVQAGWNCSSYPTDPTAHPCGKSLVDLNFEVVPSAIELTKHVEPTGKVTLCEEIPYEFIVRSTQAGNTLNNQVKFSFPVGLTPVGDYLEAEYPLYSNNWTSLVPTIDGTSSIYICDLTKITSYPSDGLPGTMSDGDIGDNRAIRIRFKLNTSCDFVSGRQFRITNTATRPCGHPAANSPSTIASSPINIAGITDTYTTNNIVTIGDVQGCSNTTVNIKTIFGGITTDPEANITLPVGFTYDGSLSTNVTLKGATLNAENRQVVTLKLPVGISGEINYSFNIKTNPGSACEANTIEFETTEKANTLSCGNVSCSDLRIQTGTATGSFNVDKPTTAITAFSDGLIKPISATQGNYSIVLTLNNTSAISANEANVSFYCVNSDNSKGTKIHTQTVNFTAIDNGAFITLPVINFTAELCDPSGKLYAVLETADNCICFPSELLTTLRIKNYWKGTSDTNWDTANNWVADRVPGEYEDVEFATNDNNPPVGGNPKSGAAINDLYVPINNSKTIGNLINETTNFATVIPAGASLKITGSVTGSSNDNEKSKIQVQADDRELMDESQRKPNGSLIISGHDCNAPIYGTVQLYAKGKPHEESWNDNIAHSPTVGKPFYSQYQWQQFGIPVVEIKTTPTFAGHYLRRYDEGINAADSYYYKWVNLANDQDMYAFKGYSITQDVPSIVNISGQLVFCEKSIKLTHSAPVVEGSSATSDYNKRYGLGQNIFGNSFTASIPVDMINFNTVTVTENNTTITTPNNNQTGNLVEHTVYLYNTGSFVQWATTDGVATDAARTAGSYLSIPVKNASSLEYGAIPSLNGFLLRHVGGDGKVIEMVMPYGNLTNNTKPQTTPRLAPKAPLSYLHIGLLSKSTIDNLWLFSQEGTTEGFDNGWDGRKNFGTPTAFIYSVTEDGPMQVNTSGTIDGKVINFYPNDDTEYVLRLVKSNLNNYNDLNLIDLEAKTVTELSADTTLYRFNSHNKGISTGRFIIVNKPYSAIDLNSDSFKLLDGYITPDKRITTINYTGKEGQIYVYNTLGSLVISDKMNQGTNIYSTNLDTGIYILTMQAGDDTKSVKVIVN